MQININVPDSFIVNDSAEDTAKRLKLYSALLLYHSGAISVSDACELAGVDNGRFVRACEEYRVVYADPRERLNEDDLEHLRRKVG